MHGITGDTGDFKEDCKSKVLSLFHDKMGMQLDYTEVVVAHRMGFKKSATPRVVVVRCTQSLRERVFAYTKNLKDIKNDEGSYYLVTPHFPEPLSTQKREQREELIAARKLNEQLDDAKKSKIEVKNGVLHLNGKAQKKHVFPPTVREMFSVTADQQ